MARLTGKLQLGAVVAVPAGETSLGAVERCVRGALDYFQRADGRQTPERIAVNRLLEALADEGRRLFVLQQDGLPVGLLELALETPSPRELTLALLVLNRAHRGRGLGALVAQALFDRLAREGFRRVHLGVAPGESAAARFWASVGMWESGSDDGVRLFELALEDRRRPSAAPRRRITNRSPAG